MLLSTATIAAMMTMVWILSLRRRDASIVDIAWGSGFVLVAWAVLVAASPRRAVDWVLPCLVTFWGLRLSGYLAWRNHGQPEDYRYRQMREKWGDAFWWVSLLTVFGLQGVVMWVVSLPIQTGIGRDGAAASWLTLLGVVLWAIGFCFEAVGDWQLARFKSNPSNKGVVLDKGLWRYTRHPNYFGDFLVWWGLFSVAWSLGAPWWTVVSPATMSVLLMYVSGVTLLEKSLTAAKPTYQTYVQQTNAFFPGPPKRG